MITYKQKQEGEEIVKSILGDPNNGIEEIFAKGSDIGTPPTPTGSLTKLIDGISVGPFAGKTLLSETANCQLALPVEMDTFFDIVIPNAVGGVLLDSYNYLALTGWSFEWFITTNSTNIAGNDSLDTSQYGVISGACSLTIFACSITKTLYISGSGATVSFVAESST